MITATAMRPQGVTKTTTPTTSQGTETSGRTSNPPSGRRIALAVSRYSTQRMPLSTNNGATRIVWSTCIRAGVFGTTWVDAADPLSTLSASAAAIDPNLGYA
jgi:hypothetical protein